jgi:hypothetical protein
MFESRQTGAITVAQLPNLPLTLFIVTAGLRTLFRPHGGVGTAISVVGAVALGWWAVAEVVRGVNPFRRILGGVVLAVALIGWATH